MPKHWLLALIALLAVSAAPGAAQEWNSPRALALVEQARALRQTVERDRTFDAYKADARGYVYFFLDHEETDERVLVKTDQVALEVFWQAPNRTRQRIVGLRDRTELPTNIRYHLDHLTVVQDEFADVIRLGDGDEVSAVVHPVATGAEVVYDYALADSVTLSYGAGQEIRVYELEVRPRDLDAPGFLGSVFVSRETAAIVRMNFTFTPASYVDDYLDYIRISLDNSVWDGEYWLPYEQRVELRREVPYLDFPAGSVIRGRYEIRNYEFDPDLGPLVFVGPRVTALPEAQREAFAFEEPLHAQVDEEGLGTLPDLAEVHSTAVRLMGKEALSGLSRSRLWLPSASSALRYNRAEGIALGAGYSFRIRDDLALRLGGGWAFGRERPSARVQLGERSSGLSVEAFWNRLNDVGPLPGAAGATNTLAGLLLDHDYTDPFFTSGTLLRYAGQSQGRLSPWLEVGWERHRSARNVVQGAEAVVSDVSTARLVRPAEEGDAFTAALGANVEIASTLSLVPSLKIGRLDDRTFTRIEAEALSRREWIERGLRLDGRGWAGWVSSDAPAQHLFLLGGRGTLPGYRFRNFVGHRFWLARMEASSALRVPWIRLGGMFALGRTHLGDRTPPPGWEGTHNSVTLGSAGVFTELLWDVVRLDLSRGLNGGFWEFQLAITRRFHPWL